MLPYLIYIYSQTCSNNHLYKANTHLSKTTNFDSTQDDHLSNATNNQIFFSPNEKKENCLKCSLQPFTHWRNEKQWYKGQTRTSTMIFHSTLEWLCPIWLQAFIHYCLMVLRNWEVWFKYTLSMLCLYFRSLKSNRSII